MCCGRLEQYICRTYIRPAVLLWTDPHPSRLVGRGRARSTTESPSCDGALLTGLGHSLALTKTQRGPTPSRRQLARPVSVSPCPLFSTPKSSSRLSFPGHSMPHPSTVVGQVIEKHSLSPHERRAWSTVCRLSGHRHGTQVSYGKNNLANMMRIYMTVRVSEHMALISCADAAV